MKYIIKINASLESSIRTKDSELINFSQKYKKEDYKMTFGINPPGFRNESWSIAKRQIRSVSFNI